jgi:hypothetical protein
LDSIKDGRVKGQTEFVDRLNLLIGRVEAWSYGDSDAGAGLPVELARDLKRLASKAPAGALRDGIRRAQDALDDGLSAETVAAALYRVRADCLKGPQASPPRSPSGESGRGSPKRGRSPNRGRSP